MTLNGAIDRAKFEKVAREQSAQTNRSALRWKPGNRAVLKWTGDDEYLVTIVRVYCGAAGVWTAEIDDGPVEQSGYQVRRVVVDRLRRTR